MKLFIIVCILIFASIVNAQSIRVEYEVTINRNTYITSTKSNYNLIINSNKSIYYNDGDNTDIFSNIDWKPDVVKDKDGKKTVMLNDNGTTSVTQDYFYKDYETDTIIYNDFSSNEKIIIAEKINIFNWKIITESDTLILNYHCQKAITEFRGRKYEAYFTSEISSFGGPWKFDGLPGLILFVKSTDDYFIMRPLKLEIHDKNKNIENPYKGTEHVFSWFEFTNYDKNKKLKVLKMMQADARHGETSRIIVKDRIEYLGYYELSSDDL